MNAFRASLLIACLAAPLVSGCGSDVETPAAAGTTLWARRFGRASDMESVGLSAYPGGGVIVAGRYYGDVGFGGATLPNPGNSYQVFVAKYDSDGNHVYSRGFGQEAAEWATDVAALPDGSALVVGGFSWKVDFGTGELLSTGGDDIFVLKVDAAGNPKWAKQLGGPLAQQATAIAAMPDGGAVISGRTAGPVDFAEGEPIDSSPYGFVLRLDPAGEPVWGKVFSGNAFQPITDVAALPGGGVVLAGNFYGSIDLGGPDPLVTNDQDGFVAAYDAQGKWQWARKVGGSGYSDTVNALAVRPDGGVVVTGAVEGTVDFGGGPLFGIEFDANTYLLDLDASGNHVRSAIYGRDGWDYGSDVAIAEDGSVALTGDVSNKIWFGLGTLTSHGSDDAFVATIDTRGNPLFQRVIGGVDREVGHRVAVDASGRVVVAGSVQGEIDLGLGSTSGSGYYETFLVSLAP